MAFTRESLVTACQQLLVAAVVSTLALTAASVVTLDIVDPEGSAQGAGVSATNPVSWSGAADLSAHGVAAGARIGAR